MQRTPGGHRRAAALVLALQVVLAGLVVAPASASSHTVTDQVRGLLEGASENATVGLYLREVGSPTPLEAHNSTFAFEPASSLKALPHFAMLRRVQQGFAVGGSPLTLERSFAWLADATKFTDGIYQPGGTDCPTNNDVDQTRSLEVLLRWMMQDSDNATTEAVRGLLWPGDVAVQATQLVIEGEAISLGMTNTQWRHVMGCGWADPANLNAPDSNRSTLVDLSNLYERVATDYLDDETRATAFSLMNNLNTSLRSIVDQEAAALGVDHLTQLVGTYRNRIESATKSGFYPIGGRFYQSSAGWASIPRQNTVTCVPDDREYTFGVFVHGSDVRVEEPGLFREQLFREVIREGLTSFAACTADLVHDELVAIDPPTAIDVNTPTPITLRHTVRNLGPGTVDARITTTRVPGGDTTCEVSLPGPEFVQQLAPNGELIREITATVTCSQPGQRSVTLQGRISPLLDTVTDPIPGNNTSLGSVSLSVFARADLEVLDVDLTAFDAAGLGDFLVGSSTWFDASATITNNGDTVSQAYADPIDAFVDHHLEVPSGLTAAIEVTADEASATVTLAPDGGSPEVLVDLPAGTLAEVSGPATITMRSAQDGLEIDQPRDLALRFAIGCAAPGDHDLGLEVRIEPQSEFVVDPDPSNNVITAQRTVSCFTPVQPNIRPGTAHNAITPGARQAVPVAVLTTEAGEYDLPIDFDATSIVPASLRFGVASVLAAGGGAAPVTTAGVLRDSFELDEVTRDGDLDLQAALRPSSDTGIDVSTSQACVTGTYVDDGVEYGFFGCDRVTVRPPG